MIFIRRWAKIIKEVESLQNDLDNANSRVSELSNRILEALNYLNNNSLYEEEYDYDYEENMYLSGISDETAKKDLEEILKGSDK